MVLKRKLVVGAIALMTALAPVAVMYAQQVFAGATQSQLPKSGFIDVPDDHPYSDFIADLHSKGKISGYDNQHFGPSNNLTRAEFATMLVKILGVPSSNQPVPFTDLGGAEWARSFIQAAYASGVVKGYDATHFGPDDPVTREQAATMVWQWLRHQGVQPASGDASAMIAGASDWAKEAVAQVVLHKLYGPEVTPAGGYQPQRNMTRAEAAAIFDLAMKLLGDCGCGQQPQPSPQPKPQPQPLPPTVHLPQPHVDMNNWTPGDSVVLGKTLFSNNFKLNSDGTATVTIPTAEQLGMPGALIIAQYMPPKDAHEAPKDLQPGQTYTLNPGNGAYVFVEVWGSDGKLQEKYDVELDGSGIANTTKRVNGQPVDDRTSLDALLRGLGVK